MGRICNLLSRLLLTMGGVAVLLLAGSGCGFDTSGKDTGAGEPDNDDCVESLKAPFGSYRLPWEEGECHLLPVLYSVGVV